MPKRFSIGLPNLDQRLKILSLVSSISIFPAILCTNLCLQLLKDTKLEPNFSMVALAERTDGLSGSDLKELCRNAAMIPMRELMRRAGSQEHLKLIADQVCVLDGSARACLEHSSPGNRASSAHFGRLLCPRCIKRTASTRS